MTSDLYHPLILEHNRNPRHFGELKAEVPKIEAYNPICGDQFDIQISWDAGDTASVVFHGYGCAVSKAATSMLLERMAGLSVAAASDLVADYLSLLASDAAMDIEQDPLSIFKVANKYPGRSECARLSAKALLNFFNNLKSA